jgi:hypothetical protein
MSNNKVNAQVLKKGRYILMKTKSPCNYLHGLFTFKMLFVTLNRLRLINLNHAITFATHNHQAF